MPRPDAIVAIDDSVAAAPFLQIFEQIRAAIERGDVRAGQPLPSVRQLAGDLGVAPNTVARAYADLRDQGYVVGEPRRALRVASASANRATVSRKRALVRAVEAFVASLESRGYDASEIAREVRERLTLLGV